MQGKPLIKQATTRDKELCQVSKPFPAIYFVSHNHCHFIFLSVLVYLYDKITKRKEEWIVFSFIGALCKFFGVFSIFLFYLFQVTENLLTQAFEMLVTSKVSCFLF